MQVTKEKTVIVPQSPVLGTVFALKIQVHEVESVGFPSGHMTSFVYMSLKYEVINTSSNKKRNHSL